jgi:RNA polymerase sigma factor (sigma-70 family)
MTDDDHGGHRARHGSFWVKALEETNERLMSYARRLANGRVYDAEDLFQETACRALAYARDPGEIRNPAYYLLRMMRNIWIDKWAKENSANVESLDDLLSSARHPKVEPVVQQVLETQELQEEMYAGQGQLTAREELLLKLHLKGYKSKDIADRLQEDVRVTRTDLNAVKAKVRYRLKKGRAKAATPVRG